MAIDIKTQSLFPVRRDKQIPQIIIGSGTSSGGASGGSYDSSINLTGYLTEASINVGSFLSSDFVWSGGQITINDFFRPPFGSGEYVPNASLGSHFKWMSGYLNVSDYISKTQVDASLNNSFNIQSYIDGSVALLATNKGVFVQCSSIGASSAHSVYWKNGYLEASMGAGTGDVSKVYVDGSLALRDTRISTINASLGNVNSILSYVNTSTYYDGSINAKTNKTLFDSSIGYLTSRLNTTDSSVNKKADKNATISYKTGAYTLTSADNNFIIEASGTFSIYLPTNLDTGFQSLIMNVGGGTITLNPSTGASFLSRDSSNDLRKPFSGATVYKRNASQWVAMGDLT
jgi:hypothetical protein